MKSDNIALSPTGKKILDAATKVFTIKGFNGATTNEIAKEAGVSEGTIFRYFDTKKELFLSLFVPAIMEMKLPEILDDLEEILNTMREEPEEEVIKAVIENRINLIRENIDIFKLIFYEAQFHPEIGELLVNKIIIKSRRIFMKYIEDRKQAGRFKDIDSGVAARSIVSLLAGHLLWHNLIVIHAPDDEILEEEKDLDEVIRLFLSGIKS